MSERDEKVGLVCMWCCASEREMPCDAAPHGHHTIIDGDALLRAPVDPPKERCNCAPFHTGHYEPECPIHGEHPPKPSDALELAWGLRANAYDGDWDSASEEWRDAAIRWRDEHWHTSGVVASPKRGSEQEPIGYVVIHHNLLGSSRPILPHPGTLYPTRESAEENANLRRTADKNTGFDDTYTVEPVGGVERGSEQEPGWYRRVNREVGCERSDGLLHIHPESETCDVCSTGVERVSEASALREALDAVEDVVLSLRMGGYDELGEPYPRDRGGLTAHGCRSDANILDSALSRLRALEATKGEG